MEKKITDIFCPNCGAPANFDIVQQKYVCGYCGGTVGIREAQEAKQGFRKMRAQKLKDSVRQYHLFSASCSGCGAEVVFGENEALSHCAFCGRNLVRTEYLDSEGMPECVIPFRLTLDEAKEQLAAWCRENKNKSEAKKLLKLLSELKGFYLPYELVRGPVHMRVFRMDGGNSYPCEGFLNDEFVNRSDQLDNLLLDGMEPYDIEALTEFDFAYLAGQRVKISDITDQELEARAAREAGETYTPAVRKTLETKAVGVNADVSSAVRLPVLLPVYYIAKDGLMAAVNGQTGKVSVRAEKESHYYFLPWWLKAIIATAVFTGASFLAFRFFGMDPGTALVSTGVLAVFFIIVILCVYSDTDRNSFSVEAGREIYTSGGKTLRRNGKKLVQDDKDLSRRMAEPVFIRNIRGKDTPCVLRFTTPARVVRMALMCTVALFLPVILALFLNGFDFERLTLGGSAVWFCIAVPVVPIYLLKFGVVELYERPWVYTKDAGGRLVRVKEKMSKQERRDILELLLALLKPPALFGVLFGLLSFCIIVYLTAFGFD